MTQEYIGTKIVTAWEQLGGSTEAVEQVPGYAMKYPDGYVSWSPKAVFEAAYVPMGQTGHLQPHQQRVVGELAELDNRLVKLKAFVELNKNNPAFPAYEMSLLRAQIPAMEKLATILEERVACF